MKKAIVCAFMVASPFAAMAQSPLLTILNDGAPPSTDVALVMMSGFIECYPVVEMMLEPNQSDSADLRPDPRGGFRYVRAMYQLMPAVTWPDGIRVLRVEQAVDFGQEPGRKPVESVTFTFNVPVEVVRRELDRRFDGRLSARLGVAHHNEPLWYEAAAANALRCLRQPDL
jgi:hypothetical protein